MKRGRTVFRAYLVRGSFIALFMVVLGRVGYVQSMDSFLRGKEQRQWLTEESVMPMRGSIYDANGDELAFSTPAYDLDLYLPGIQGAGFNKLRAAADGLASITGAQPSFMLKQLSRSQVSWLRMYPYMVHVPLATKERVLALFTHLGLYNDINPYKTYKRVYPDGSFAAHVVGFVDQTGAGAAGIELQYNHFLAGTPGQVQFMQDSMGDPLPFRSVVTKPVQNGDSVYLTIDAAIQHYAEEALATIQRRFTPAHAAIIVADPNTGAILAMAALPNFNPGQYWTYPAATLDTNWAISAPFEPGSTFKVVTLTGALASHSIKLNQTYMSGVDYVNGVPIRDWNLWGWGRITYRMAMIYSSNTGFIHIGQAEGVPTLYKYIHLFGMDQPTGIDLPGEGTSLLFNPHNLNPVDFATMTFGQGLAVTPIQQLAEVGAVANGGHLMTPYVVQKVVAPGGRIVYYRRPHIVRRVAPAAIMNEVTNIMIQDVNQDPALMAYVPGYNVAGKTGTAQIPKPGGGYMPHKYNLSFVGFVPAHHPALEIFVTVSEPHNTIQYGNDVASPAAKFVLQKALSYLRIPPHGQALANPATFLAVTAYTTIPDVQGLSVKSATQLLKRAGLAAAAVDASGTVVREWPQPGTQVASGTQVVIATSASTSLSGKVRVPNLKGMPMIEAVSVCSLLGLQIDPKGDGYVVQQSISPGREVPLGTILITRFAPISTVY